MSSSQIIFWITTGVFLPIGLYLIFSRSDRDWVWGPILTVIGTVALCFAIRGVLHENKQPNPPNLVIIGYKVDLSNPSWPPFANLYAQNLGGEGSIMVYSYAGLALLSANPAQVRAELDSARQKVVSEGGGLKFTVRAKQPFWFTITGPQLTPKQQQGLKAGALGFYFSATIVNGAPGRDYELCNFVAGNKPDVILQCPEN